MSKEMFWLTLTALMTAVFWVPYVLNRIAVRGLIPAMGYAGPDAPPHAPWAERAMLAHKNAVENLVVFAALAVAVEVTKANSATTALACAVYFWARLVHFVVYTARVPVVRTLSFAVAWAAVVALALALLKVI